MGLTARPASKCNLMSRMPGTILVVEDEEAIRMTLEDRFKARATASSLPLMENRVLRKRPKAGSISSFSTS